MIVLCNYLCHLHSKFMPWGYNVCHSVLPLLTFSYTLFLCMYQLYKVLFLMRLELFLPTATIYYETLYKMYWDSWHGFWGCFLAFDFLSVRRGHSFFHPRHSGQWPPTSKDFYPRFYPLHFLSYLYSSKRTGISLFNVECQTGTTGTIFITSLVWRGPWLGIEPGTSHTRCQHYTTRLSTRWCWHVVNVLGLIFQEYDLSR